jgi:hypothetical protein
MSSIAMTQQCQCSSAIANATSQWEQCRRDTTTRCNTSDERQEATRNNAQATHRQRHEMAGQHTRLAHHRQCNDTTHHKQAVTVARGDRDGNAAQWPAWQQATDRWQHGSDSQQANKPTWHTAHMAGQRPKAKGQRGTPMHIKHACGGSHTSTHQQAIGPLRASDAFGACSWPDDR